MKKLKAIVVDDELASRTLISEFILELNSNFEVLRKESNINDAFKSINEINPDVVFLDIKMPGGGGFELLSRFETINFEVVFISGFDTYALKAFEFNALDYVLKPVDPSKFIRTLEKVYSNVQKKTLQGLDIMNLVESLDFNRHVIAKIPIHNMNRVHLLPISDMLYLKWQEGCTVIKTSTNQIYTSSRQLGDLEFILEKHPYIVRVNKSAFINLNLVASYSKGVDCIITLTDGTEFGVSRRKKGEMLELLKMNGAK